MLTSIINTDVKNHKSKPFPKFMKYKNENFVILATQQNGSDIVGMVIKTEDSSYPLGHYSEKWSTDFHDWEGSITLTQE